MVTPFPSVICPSFSCFEMHPLFYLVPFPFSISTFRYRSFLPSLYAKQFLLHVYPSFPHILRYKFPSLYTHLHYFVIEPLSSLKYVVLTV